MSDLRLIGRMGCIIGSVGYYQEGGGLWDIWFYL